MVLRDVDNVLMIPSVKWIVFDDYGFRDCPGAKEAIEEALGADCPSFIPLPTGQAIYVSRPWQPGAGAALTETDATASPCG